MATTVPRVGTAWATHTERYEKVTDGLSKGREAVVHVIDHIVASLGFGVEGIITWVDA